MADRNRKPLAPTTYGIVNLIDRHGGDFYLIQSDRACVRRTIIETRCLGYARRKLGELQA